MSALCLLGPARPAWSGTAATDSVPGAIRYQGTLSDDGVVVTGTRQMSFRVYDSLSGGNLLWSAASADVDFDRGFFSASLSVTTAAFSTGAPAFLEVQVGSVILSPRDPVYSAPYALVAKSLEGSLDTAGGGLSIASSLTVSSTTGKVGVATTDPQSALDIRGLIGAGGASGLSITAAGNAGFGALSPAAPATVAGDLRLTGAGVLIFPDSTQQTTALVLGTPSSITSAASVPITGDSGAAGSGDAVLRTGAVAVDRLRAFNNGKVGIGSLSPAGKLHLSSGVFIIDGASASLALGPSGFVLAGGLVGIGTSSPGALLDGAGASQFGAGAAKSTFTAAGNLQLLSGSTITSRGDLTVSTAALLSVKAMSVDPQGRVGVWTGSPALTLDVDGSAGFGSASKSLVDQRGNLRLAAGSTISSPGTLSISTAASAGATGRPALFLDSSGNLGLGTAAPTARFEVASSTQTLLRKRASIAGSAGLGVVIGSIGKTGSQVCGTGACLAYWESSGVNLGCTGVSGTTARALCAGFGD